jgi:putative endonuclease
MNNVLLGKLGESYAQNFLTRNGFQVLKRNFRYNKSSEIDIIAKKGREVDFIEVKTRVEFELKEHHKSINNFKVLKIKRGVSKFLAENSQFYSYEHKIKAIIVLINPYNREPQFVFYDYLD